MQILKQLEEERAAEETPKSVEIFDKKGQSYGFTLDVRGEDSEAVRMASRAITDRMLRERVSVVGATEAYQSRVDKAVAAITGWSLDDAFEEDALRGLLEFEHILRQVEAVMKDHAAFSETQSEG